MEIPFSDQDLSRESSPLVLRTYPKIDLGSKELILDKSETLVQGLPKPWMNLFKIVDQGDFFELHLSQADLFFQLKEIGLQNSLDVSCHLVTNHTDLELQEEFIKLSYRPDNTIKKLGHWTWTPGFQKINLTKVVAPTWLSLGSLSAKSKKKLSLSPCFCISLKKEGGNSYTFQDEDFAMIQLGESSVIACRNALNGAQYLDFPQSMASNVALRISESFLLDNRIEELAISFEDLTAEGTARTVILPVLGDTPSVDRIEFVPDEGVLMIKDTFVLSDGVGVVKVGDFKVEVTDCRGEGYSIDGVLKNDAAQQDRPVVIESETPGMTLNATTQDNFEDRRLEHTFSLIDDEQNRINQRSASRHNLKYEHLIPIEVELDKLDFRNSKDGTLCLEIVLEVDGNEPYESKIVIKGGEASVLKRLSPTLEEKTLKYSKSQTTLEVDRFTLRNTCSVITGQEVSIQIDEVKLLDAETGQPSSEWLVEIHNEVTRQKLSDFDLLSLSPLGPRQNLDLRIILHPLREMSLLESNQRLKLAYRIKELHHNRDTSINHWEIAKPEEVKVSQYSIALTVGPVVNRTFISIDLGTSAIVAAVTDDRKGEFAFEFLDLQSRLKTLREEAGLEYNSERQPENGSPFIASNIILKNKRRIDTSSLKDSAVGIAPELSSLVTVPNQWLPNLKMIFGRSGIPKLKKAFGEDFIYSIDAKVQRTPSDQQEVINQALQALTSIVINGFIIPHDSIKLHKDNLLEIVFTVPNNFAPAYRERIETWASETRGNGNPGTNVSFLSESDAVAYSYLDYWQELHPGKNPKESETILAYDIGAGTVDLSLIERSYSKIDRKSHEVRVLGRVGLPKAGNYLDYVIAKAVIKHFGHSTKHAIFQNLEYFEFSRDISQVIAFHQWIRNQVKPEMAKVARKKSDWGHHPFQLSEATKAFVIVEDLKNTTIDLAYILGDTEFQAYLDSVSSIALDKLIQISHGNSKKVNIDTVLFSGRTIQLTCLRQAVINAVENINQTSNKPTIIYSDHWPLREMKRPEHKLKGLVALGGIRYLRRYRHFSSTSEKVRIKEQKIDASYGLFFNDSATATPNYCFIPLVTPRHFRDYDRPYKQKVSFGAAKQIYLLQTYEHECEKIEAHFNPSTHVFSGDYTVNLLEDTALFPVEYGCEASSIKEVSLQITSNEVMQFTFRDASKNILFTKEIRNFRRGYNTYSPEATHSLWPVIMKEKKS